MLYAGYDLNAGSSSVRNIDTVDLTDLVEKEVVDVVGEESSELALLGLTGPHVHLYLLNEPAQAEQSRQTHIRTEHQL